MNDPQPATSSHHQDQVAARAREIWLSRGQPGGMDVDIWLEAERDVKARNRSTLANDTAVTPSAGTGVTKTRRGKSLTEKVQESLEGRPGVGQGGNAQILKQTT